MRDGTVITLLIVLVIASAGAGYYAGTSSSRIVPTTLTSTTIQPCAGQVVWNVNSSSSLVPVLLMEPSTTAYACVT